MAFPFFMVTYHQRVCKKNFRDGWYGYQSRHYTAGNRCHTGRVDEEAADLVQDVLVMQLPAPNLLVRRMNRQDAAAVLGHTDLRTTQIYCYISLANVKSAYRKYAA